MHLIEALAAGVAGCENGTFDIVLRGTSTPANYYTDFEGDTAPIVGTAVPLDARGGGTFYVNSLVKVTCKSSLGATIREFIAGDAGTAVEVRSDSFTGAAYVGGALAAGNPTTLAAVLDAWNNSAGAIDWKVLYNGAATNLQTVVAALTGQLQFVVTSYGALGNNVADDRTAINAAIAAANAAGGGVVLFPPGTYRITGPLTCFSTTVLLGVDAAASKIRLDHATAQIITGTGPASVTDMQFYISANHAGNMFNLTGGPADGTVFSGCIFNNNTFSVGMWIASTTIAPTLVRCLMDLGPGDSGIACSVSNSELRLFNCDVNTGTTAGTVLSCINCLVVGSKLRSLVTSGTTVMITATGNGPVIIGCYLQGPTSAAVNFKMFVMSGGSGILREFGNVIETQVPAGFSSTHKIYDIASSNIASSCIGSRLTRSLTLSTSLSNADPIVIPAAEAATIVVQNNSTAGHSGNVGINIDVMPPGSPLDLHIWNDTAAPITYQWGTGCVGTATFAVAANSVRTFRLSCVAAPTTLWRIVSDAAGSEVAEA